MSAKHGTTDSIEVQDEFSKYRMIWKAESKVKIMALVVLLVFIAFSLIPLLLIVTSLILNGSALGIIEKLGYPFLFLYVLVFVTLVFIALIIERIFYNKYIKIAQRYLTKYYSEFTKSPPRFFQNKNPWFFKANPDFLKAEFLKVKLDKATWDVTVEYKYTALDCSEKTIYQKETKVHTENLLVILGVIDDNVKRFL